MELVQNFKNVKPVLTYFKILTLRKCDACVHFGPYMRKFGRNGSKFYSASRKYFLECSNNATAANCRDNPLPLLHTVYSNELHCMKEQDMFCIFICCIVLFRVYCRELCICLSSRKCRPDRPRGWREHQWEPRKQRSRASHQRYQAAE